MSFHSPRPVVHVVDDDPAIRDSLHFLLATAGHGARTYASASEFLELADAGPLRTGCVVTDVRMPQVDGPELARRLKARDVHLPVILVAGDDDVPLALEGLRAGAWTFLKKPLTDRVFLGAVDEAVAVAGAPPPPEEVQARYEALVHDLSRREREVLQRMVRGRSSAEIAAELDIIPSAVRVYRATVMAKTGVSGLAELARIVFRAGHG